MWDWTRHDYAHCNQSKCEQKDVCFRYQLYQEDKQSPQETYCAYLIISEEQSKCCNSFISIKQT